MSFEETLIRQAAALEDLAKAVKGLTASVSVLLIPGAERAEEVARQANGAANVDTQTSVIARPRGRPPGSSAKPAASSVPQPVAESLAPADEAVKYETVREAILSLAERKGHPAAVAVLAKFGVKTARDLKPEQYSDALTTCKTA